MRPRGAQAAGIARSAAPGWLAGPVWVAAPARIAALTRTAASFALAATLALAPTAPVSAQQADPGWFGAIFYDADFFSGSSSVWTNWSTVRGLVSRRFDGGTLGIEGATTQRFELRDESLTVDGYVDLWSGAYAHVRGRAAPEARLLPLSDWRLELFHALPGGWEASGGVWLMNIRGPDVEVVSLGMAKYVSRWYLRGRASVAGIAGEQAEAASIFARRFLGGDSRQYIEWGGGLGSEVVILGPGPLLEARETWFLAGSFQSFVLEPFGIHVSAGLNDFEGVPRRIHLTAGLLARF